MPLAKAEGPEDPSFGKLRHSRMAGWSGQARPWQRKRQAKGSHHRRHDRDREAL